MKQFSYTKEVEAGGSSIDSNWLNGCCIFYTWETEECTTPDVKNDRRANSLQLSSGSNAIPNHRSTPTISRNVFWGGLAVSQISMPISTLGGRHHFIVFPKWIIRTCALDRWWWDESNVEVWNWREKCSEYAKWWLANGVMKNNKSHVLESGCLP